MKVFLSALMLACLVSACPDEPLCRSCGNTEETKLKCRLCDNAFRDPFTSKCTAAKKAIAGCQEYGVIPEDEQNQPCTKCNNGYFLNINKCDKCGIANCGICSAEDVCSACLNGKKLDGEHKSCTNDDCPLAHCSLCQYLAPGTEPTCMECRDNFALSADSGLCVATKKTNCLEVRAESDGERCITCQSGYKLTSKWECSGSGVAPGKSKLWIVFVVLLVVGLLAGGAFYFYKHRQTNTWRRPNEPLIN